MAHRLQTSLLVQSLVRCVAAEGGFAAVLQKGDAVSGTIIVACIGGDRQICLYERMSDFSGGYSLSPIARKDWGNDEAIMAYIGRRTQSDPDLWVVELDVPNGEQLAAGLLGSN